MKTTMVLMSVIALTAKLAATSYGPPESHDVASTNGKFNLHVDAGKDTHRITGDFGAGNGAWKFTHEVGHHRFFVSNDGEAAVVVHWSWIQDYDLDEPAVAIYGRFGAKRTYSYRELSQPRKPEPGTIGPVGDFWRIWRSEATSDGNKLTIRVEGGPPRVIDLKNPPPVTALLVDPSRKEEHREGPDAKNGRELKSKESESPRPADTQAKPAEAEDEWSKADRMIAEHFEKTATKSRSAVYSSHLLEKYLPDFKVHVLYDVPNGPETSIFMVHRTGEITPLPGANWTGEATEPTPDTFNVGVMRSPNIAKFLANRKIPVKNAEDAVEVAKLFMEIQRAANYVASLNINTKDFKSFNREFMEGSYGPERWAYSAKKSNNGWSVDVAHTGPMNVSIMAPPTYEMILDEQQLFKELEHH